MADNVVVSPASGPGGATVACDDIGGVQHQRVKLVLGADGVSDGDVSSANPMPVISTDSVHDRTHAGQYFSGGHYNGALANNGTLDLLIQNGGASTFHAKFSAQVGGDCTVQIFEGTTFSVAGTAVTMSNHNRASGTAFAGTVTHTPTVTLVGAQVNGTGFAPGGTKHSGSGGEFGFNNEFVLSPTTNYLLRVTNVSGTTIKLSASVEGYQPSL
jgi:hypothetical protein